MKTKQKCFFAIALCCMVFIAVSSFSEIRNTLTFYLPTATIFILFILGLVNILLLKQPTSEEKIKREKELEQLQTQLKWEISERELIEKKLHSHNEHITQLAQYDELTSLPNRIFFNETLNKTLKHAKRRNMICALLAINLDSFNHVNEKWGRQQGDFILKEIADRFVKTLRSEDLIARWDGDSFIVLLNDITKPKFASSVAEKLLSACSKPITLHSEELTVTASIGICIYPNDGDSLETLLNNVDTALQKAKQNGKRLFQFYTHELDTEAREYIKLENALRNAIKNNELVLYYQPKLHIKQGTLAGVEALMRWNHPEYGLINPSTFIPIAEETGLIMQIGEWALKEACRMNKNWQQEGYEHVTIAVNLSPKEFNHPDIATLIENALNESNLHPGYLEIEISEQTIMSDINTAKKILNKIKEKGVQLSIDHFGVGYTSISQLKQLPINAVKIDQLFIKGIPNSPDDMAITNALIALLKNLELEVIAEGVETAEQVQYLADQQCDLVQGYYLSRPVSSQNIILQFKKLTDEILI